MWSTRLGPSRITGIDVSLPALLQRRWGSGVMLDLESCSSFFSFCFLFLSCRDLSVGFVTLGWYILLHNRWSFGVLSCNPILQTGIRRFMTCSPFPLSFIHRYTALRCISKKKKTVQCTQLARNILWLTMLHCVTGWKLPIRNQRTKWIKRFRKQNISKRNSCPEKLYQTG